MHTLTRPIFVSWLLVNWMTSLHSIHPIKVSQDPGPSSPLDSKSALKKLTGREERVTSVFSITAESPKYIMFLCVYWSIPGINETNVMAGIAPLKAHPVKMSYNERSQPSKKWNGGRHIARSAIYSTRGRFCCYYSDYWELHALHLPSFLYTLLLIVTAVRVGSWD